MIRCKAISSALFVGASLVGAGAQAQPDYAFSYSADDLATSAGVADLHARIVKEAKDACPDYLEVRSRADVSRCIDGVVDDLVEKVDHPKLTSYHQDGARVEVADTEIEAGRDSS